MKEVEVEKQIQERETGEKRIQSYQRGESQVCKRQRTRGRESKTERLKLAKPTSAVCSELGMSLGNRV